MLDVLDLGSNSQVLRFWQQFVADPGSLTHNQLRSFWESIFNGHSFPQDRNANLSLAVPYFYDCVNRAMIMDILKQDYGYQAVTLIPRPLAVLGGFLALHPKTGLQGNLLCILPDEEQIAYSFISLSDRSIILETHGTGDWAAIQEEARRLGFLLDQEWQIQHLLSAGSASSAIWDQSLIGTEINRLNVENLQDTILLGLHYWAAANRNALWGKKLAIIYPYDFYLRRSDVQNNTQIQEKLTFDTANLAIDMMASYQIASLSAKSLFLNPEDEYVGLTIYERERTARQVNPFQGQPALHLQLSQPDARLCLEIVLDVPAAVISLKNNEEKRPPSQSWFAEEKMQIASKQEVLLQLLKNNAHLPFLGSLIGQHLLRPEQDLPSPLEIELGTIQLELYRLLALWLGDQ